MSAIYHARLPRKDRPLRPEIAITRVVQSLCATALAVRDHAMAPAEPLDALHRHEGVKRPVLTRVSDAVTHTSKRVWGDQLSPLTLIGRSYMAVRQFLPMYVMNPTIGGVTLTGVVVASLIGPLVGRHQTPGAQRTKYDLPPLAQRALIVGLLAMHLLVFREAELTGMAVSSAVHLGARLLPNVNYAQKPAAWTALGAYIVTSQVAFEMVGLHNRNIVPAPLMNVTDTTCNGLDEICDKQLCDTVFPSAHNALGTPHPFAHIGAPLNLLGMAASNQLMSLDELFKRGIRGFTLEYYLDGGTLMTSHNVVWNIEPFTKTLERFRILLDENPREVIMIQAMAQGTYNGTDMEKAFYQSLNDSGMAKYMVSN